MHASPINRAGVVAGGTAAVATVAETARTVAEVKYSVASLGDWLLPVLLLVIVVLCGFVVWNRFNQRKEGWT
jgi:lysozyme